MLYGSYSTTPTTSSSVKIFVFNLFFLGLQCTSSQPNDTPHLVWLFRSGCTTYAASSHVHSWLRLYDPITLLLFIFCFRNCSTHFSFAFSYTFLLVTLAQRNYIDGPMSGLTIFLPKLVLQLWNVGCLPLFCKVLVNSHLYSVNIFSSDDTIAFKSSLNNVIDYSM